MKARKTVSGIFLSLLLISMLTSAFNVLPVKAAMAAVYIMADGSIDPSTAPIQRNGNIYTLTDNITSDYDGIWIQRSNVVLDGAGYTAQRSEGKVGGGSGIYLQGRNNVTIMNVEITHFSIGIEITGSSHDNVSGNIITANNDYGIWLDSSSNNNIENNIVASNGQLNQTMGDGIMLGSSSGNNVSGNYVTANGRMGIWLSDSSSNRISGNNITDNGYSGIWLSFRCPNNAIVGNNITGNGGHGIELYDTSYTSISGNYIATNGYDGIVLGSSSDNSVVGNSITWNYMQGIHVYYSKYNSISGNHITQNSWDGIQLFSSSNNRISANNIEANYVGIYLYESSDNGIVGNDITANSINGLELYQSSRNIISGNNIVLSYYGICLFESSSNNAICHNNFVNNVQQVSTYNSVNFWDEGYPSGGNYWSDYMGSDLDNDGIGDTPYFIDADNIDRYPHMTECVSTAYLYPSNIITEEGKTFSVSIITSRVQNLWAWQAGIQWDPATLEYVSCSWGEFQAIAGASQRSLPTIDSIAGKSSKPALESALRGWFAPVSVADMKLLTVAFKAIKAGTSSLKLIDVSLRSQNSTGTTAYPRWSDVNCNGTVDAEDITFTYGCWEGGYYNQMADFNDDGKVDITDISIVTSDFGKRNTDPEWGVTNTIYDIPVAIVSAQVYARPSEAYISVPYHAQMTGYYCGPAALEMVFDFYGPDINQLEIADAARTASDGTYTCDMVRAAHFSNLSTSMGREMPLNVTGYTARELGYVAFECGGMTIDDLKSLILAGYPVIVLTTWHFRVVVGFDSTYITFQDSYYGSMYQMTYAAFDTDWDYSGHWGLFVSPWKVKVSNPRNVLPGDIFDVTATTTYPWAPPFPKGQYPASVPNATITLPSGLSLVPGEAPKKPIGWGYLASGDSASVTWTVQANSLGGYAISVEAEGKVEGFVPPLPSYDFGYNYEDRIGGSGQGFVAVTLNPDESPPTTIDDYDNLWRSQRFKINLTAADDNSGVMETYYKINNGPVKTLSVDGQPYITTSSANNTLEYWSEDWAGNEELPHKFLYGIKLDNVKPTIGVPSRTPSGSVQPDQETKVAVNVTDNLTGVENVTLFYTINNGVTWESLTMQYNISVSLYETAIPAQPAGTWVKFKIVAYDHIGNIAIKDNYGKYYVYQVQANYELNISATMGGTTNPAPGKYFYWVVTSLSVTATPKSGYKFDHWELNNVNVGSTNPYTILVDKNQTLRAVFLSIPPPVVSISPLSASINLGDSLSFTSTVIEGMPPYSYQWYLNGLPVLNATSDSWVFTPVVSGSYSIHLKVTDNNGEITQSQVSYVTVSAPPVPPVPPVGGYSSPIKMQTTASPLTLCIAMITILAALLIMLRCKWRQVKIFFKTAGQEKFQWSPPKPKD